MNPHLSEDALAFGQVADGAFATAGGVDIARRAESDPSLRATEIAALVDRLGIGDMDARADLESAEAAAALCRAAGRVVLPYPVVPLVLDHLALHAPATGGSVSLVDHGDLFDTWRLATITGDVVEGSCERGVLGTRLGPFVAGVQGGRVASASPMEICLHLTLTGFVIAGALTAAVELATAHVVDRVQFDQPLSAFQAVQFQLADAHVLVAGVDEMVQFALWRCHVASDAAIADALGARLAALDAARSVLRITQQLHGAAGVCDEYDISVIVRHLQASLRLPFGAETTARYLVDSIENFGFVGLFDHGGVTT